LYDGDAIDEVPDDTKVMADVDDDRVTLQPDLADHVEQLRLSVDVETGSRLSITMTAGWQTSAIAIAIPHPAAAQLVRHMCELGCIELSARPRVTDDLTVSVTPVGTSASLQLLSDPHAGLSACAGF
jgi:hypothetical protein